MSEKLLPVLSSRICMGTGLPCRSFIHVESIFVCGVKKGSTFILWHVSVQFPNTACSADSCFPRGESFLLCQRVLVHRAAGLSLGSLFLSVGLRVCFSATTVLSWSLWLCTISQNLGYCGTVFPFLLQHCFHYSRSLLNYTGFRIVCFSSAKNAVGSERVDGFG